MKLWEIRGLVQSLLDERRAEQDAQQTVTRYVPAPQPKKKEQA